MLNIYKQMSTSLFSSKHMVVSVFWLREHLKILDNNSDVIMFSS